MRRLSPAIRLLSALTLLVLVSGGATAAIIASADNSAHLPAAVAPVTAVFKDASRVAAEAATPVRPQTALPVRPQAAVPAPIPIPEQRCFGAPSADARHPCVNPALRLAVYPAPADAGTVRRGSLCDRKRHLPHLDVCFWGTPRRLATRTIALIGDSHATHWRAAMDDVVRAHHWAAVSMSRAGCPMTLAHPHLPGYHRQYECMAWNRAVQGWIAAHPFVSVVFTSAHRSSVVAPPGRDMRAVQRSGYAAAFRTLLRHHVRHIVVIRDTPRNGPTTLACVNAAIAQRQPAGQECAVPRAYALRPDPMAEAGARMGDPRVEIVDLSDLLCDPTACPPVIGGSLVRRDNQHMAQGFSKTLGPYLLQAVDRLAAAWPDRDGHVRR